MEAQLTGQVELQCCSDCRLNSCLHVMLHLEALIYCALKRGWLYTYPALWLPAVCGGQFAAYQHA